ncbi:fimbrial protein [Pseudomonas marginalis]|nr:fimbrial protein [Pseudomonas marginalis]
MTIEMNQKNSSGKKTEGCRPKDEFRSVFLRLALFVMCSAGLIPKAFSACATTPVIPTAQTISLAGGIPVSPNASVGSVIYTRTLVFASNTSTPYITCSGNEARSRYWFFNNLAYGTYTPEIIRTHVSGLGLRIKGPDGRYIRDPRDIQSLPSGPLSLTYAGENTLTIELVKMSPTLGAFSLSAIQVANIGYYVFDGARDLQIWNIAWNGNIQSSAATCSTSDINVSLGRHASSIFTNVGDKSPAVPFVVNVKCINRTPNVGIRLDPVFTALNADNGIISLDPSSGATGLGMQIMTQTGTPVNLNLPIKNSVAPANDFAFALQAAFIKTAPIVSAGIGKSSVMVTITYQ